MVEGVDVSEAGFVPEEHAQEGGGAVARNAKSASFVAPTRNILFKGKFNSSDGLY